jgi:hypothetical protein
MRERCLSKTCKDYKNYGGRGITICSRWDSFEAFVEDMGERPEGLTLDRIDSNGNYEPSNCRWADRTTQNINRDYIRNAKGYSFRNNKWRARYMIDGVTYSKTFSTEVEAKNWFDTNRRLL